MRKLILNSGAYTNRLYPRSLPVIKVWGLTGKAIQTYITAVTLQLSKYPRGQCTTLVSRHAESHCPSGAQSALSLRTLPA